MIKEPQSTGPAPFSFLEHDEAELYSFGVKELLFCFLLVYTACYTIKNVLDVFFFFGAFRGVSFPVGTKEL